MPHFILQTDQDGLLQEFPNAVRNSCSFQNWYHHDHRYTWELCSDPEKIPHDTLIHAIPIGTIEFCEQFLKLIGKEPLIPALNIPLILGNYAHRGIWWDCNERDVGILLQDHKRLFIKEQGRCKGFSDIVNLKSTIPGGKRYLVSRIIPDIKAEWRIFFDRGKIVDAKPYILDEWFLPDREEIEDMLFTWKEQPPAGTIDVAIDKKCCQYLLECHPFVSVGLYGLDEAEIAPMAQRAWKWVLAEEENNSPKT